MSSENNIYGLGGGGSGSGSGQKSKDMIDLEYYRKLVKQFCDMRRYQTALFWAEKVTQISENQPRDVYCKAQCMFLLKEYHRAAHTIRLYNLQKSHIACYNLLLESLYEAKEYNEAAAIISAVDVEFLTTSLYNQAQDGGNDLNGHSVLFGDERNRNELLATSSLMKGKIYEALENRGMAMDCYVQALHQSIYCYEALDALVKHEMLMASEEKELIQHLPLEQQSNEANAKLITKLYETKLKKYYETSATLNNLEQQLSVNFHSMKFMKELNEKVEKVRASKANLHRNVITKLTTPTATLMNNQTQIMSPAYKILEDLKVPTFSLQVSLSRASSLVNEQQRSHPETPLRNYPKNNLECAKQLIPLSVCLTRIQNSTDVMAAQAEKYFYDCEYKKAFQILDKLLKIDPYHNGALTVQIGCLVEFGDYNKLFYVAHKLVDRYPDKAISWYAVGCYYDLIGKSDPARRYLSKASTLDRLYGPAWLAFGHSFAKENEHDQAMAAYFKATQLMRGCHLPLLYIGVECGLTKNLELAEKFFYQATCIAPMDVFVLYELGVIKYEYEFFDSAEEVFRITLDLITNRAKRNNEEISSRWEPLFNNLGHCCRKTKKYQEALQYHQHALLFKPQNSPTYTAIGFIYALMDNLEEAITYFHKSLAINRDCIVTSTILKSCIEELMDGESIINDIHTEITEAHGSGGDTPKCSKYPAVKLKFDDDSNINNDMNAINDASMDIC